MNFKRKAIYYFRLGYEGHPVRDLKHDRKHMFIILSKEGYNSRSNYIVGVPIGSTEYASGEEKQRMTEFGIDITGEDCDYDENISGNLIHKRSSILFDGLCKISKDSHIPNPRVDDGGFRINKEKHREIIQLLVTFMENNAIVNFKDS